MNLYNIDENKAFLVSLKGLIVYKGRLLVLKNTADQFWKKKSQWELPGGIIEIREKIEKALIREVKEETGFKISVENVFAVWDHWEHNFKLKDKRIMDIRIVEIAYFCKKIGGKIKLSDEHSHFKWASKKTLRDLDFAPNSKKAIEKYLAL